MALDSWCAAFEAELRGRGVWILERQPADDAYHGPGYTYQLAIREGYGAGIRIADYILNREPTAEASRIATGLE